MAAQVQNDYCSLLVAVPPKQSLPTVAELCSELEAPEPARKTAALKVRRRSVNAQLCDWRARSHTPKMRSFIIIIFSINIERRGGT